MIAIILHCGNMREYSKKIWLLRYHIVTYCSYKMNRNSNIAAQIAVVDCNLKPWFVVVSSRWFKLLTSLECHNSTLLAELVRESLLGTNTDVSILPSQFSVIRPWQQYDDGLMILMLKEITKQPNAVAGKWWQRVRPDSDPRRICRSKSVRNSILLKTS